MEQCEYVHGLKYTIWKLCKYGVCVGVMVSSQQKNMLVGETE